MITINDVPEKEYRHRKYKFLRDDSVLVKGLDNMSVPHNLDSTLGRNGG